MSKSKPPCNGNRTLKIEVLLLSHAIVVTSHPYFTQVTLQTGVRLPQCSPNTFPAAAERTQHKSQAASGLMASSQFPLGRGCAYM